MTLVSKLRWAGLTFILSAVTITIDTVFLGSIDWSGASARQMDAWRGTLVFAPIAAVLTVLFAQAVQGWSREVAEGSQRAWVITGTVAGFVPIAGWLVLAPEWSIVHLDSRVSPLLCIVAPLAAAIAFLFLVINALIARRSSLQQKRGVEGAEP